jgi:hypothetical protein
LQLPALLSGKTKGRAENERPVPQRRRLKMTASEPAHKSSVRKIHLPATATENNQRTGTTQEKFYFTINTE